MILTGSGEVGIEVGGAQYTLRPSLAAISSIGTPAQIVEVFADVIGGADYKTQLESAIYVLYCCVSALDDQIMAVFGYHDEDPETGMLRRHAPKGDPQDLIVIAQSLLIHGVTGGQEATNEVRPSASEYKPTFEALDAVSMAMAHLGASSSEAWNMTMTEFVGAMRAKFPQDQNATGAAAPSRAEAAATEEWFDSIAAIRDN